MKKTARGSRLPLLILLLLFALAAVLYFWDLRSNPPGFHIDESSVAYNAYLIATRGKDEHGISWPLFFRAFGEYKNPVYIYLLAAWFFLTGPGMFAARCLSAAAGVATAAVLGLLAGRVSQRRAVGLSVAALALLTPWMFELSRLVLEVALYPMVTSLFLLAVWRASTRRSWSWPEIVSLAATLTLLTYTYSIGRLLAPLLALGLCFFASRARRRGLVLTIAAYALTLIPMGIVRQEHPEALTGRFYYLTYLTPHSTALQIIRDFVKHYLGNLNPWRLFIVEQSKVSEIVHLPGAPALLTITAVLIAAGFILILRRQQLSAWWLFVFYGIAVSVVPASLTNDYFHMLRLSPLPVFLIVLTIPALTWLMEGRSMARRIAIVTVVLALLGQAGWFQWQYHASAKSPQRLHTFDADYPAKILPAALASAPAAPVYLADNPARPGYIQAYWYGTLQKIPLAKFVSLGFDQAPPAGAVVITTESPCVRCSVVAESEPYTTYIAQGQPRSLTAMTADAFKAEITLANPARAWRSGEQTTIQVTVRNISERTWLARERSASPFQLQLGNHWLDPDGRTLVNDDGRAALPHDLAPGEAISIPLIVNAPSSSGKYLLEIDMLQEDVSWFALRGSSTLRLPITIE
ncbi:MAG TPA: glycosyltransferase family 39 protein [Pyrinomonadaceae bacterium]|nr:glycosyltransferase family 39 protein [Pyrinomonadaceae bacterium]